MNVTGSEASFGARLVATMLMRLKPVPVAALAATCARFCITQKGTRVTCNLDRGGGVIALLGLVTPLNSSIVTV